MKTNIPSFVSTLILTLITTVVLVGLSIYRAISAKPEPVISESVTKSLDPTLDISVIEKIRGRIFLTEGEIPETQIQAATTATSTPTPRAIQTAQPTSTATAVPSETPSPSPEVSATPSQ